MRGNARIVMHRTRLGPIARRVRAEALFKEKNDVKRIHSIAWLIFVWCSCAEPEEEGPPTDLSALIGPLGGTIAGPDEGLFAGVRVEIPEGALGAEVEIVVRPAI